MFLCAFANVISIIEDFRYDFYFIFCIKKKSIFFARKNEYYKAKNSEFTIFFLNIHTILSKDIIVEVSVY